MRAGQSVLVHGAPGGIGTFAIHWARAIGATVITTAGSDSGADIGRRLGAAAAINYRTTDFVVATQEATGGEGVDAILDVVGGPYLKRNLNCLADDGHLVTISGHGIVGDDGTEVSRGTVGEVTVRGSNVMLGYWQRPQDTADTVRDGWMHNGDGAYMDDAGYIFIVDRIKDMIITGGENVYSAEVENAIAQHQAVASAAVIGVPDDRWGESVHAVVVLQPGRHATEDDLQDLCRSLIASYKVPRTVAFHRPTTNVGRRQSSQTSTATTADHWLSSTATTLKPPCGSHPERPQPAHNGRKTNQPPLARTHAAKISKPSRHANVLSK